MLTKSAPIEHNIGIVAPGDVVVLRFNTREDESYKIKRAAHGMGRRRDIKYKAIKIMIDLHIHYYIGNKKEKTTSAGLQNVFTSSDGSIKAHRIVFTAPGFEPSKFVRACLYLSTDSVSSVISINDISVEVKKEKDVANENKLMFVSTWGIKCGIATYSGFLVDAIKNIHITGESGIGSGTEIDIISINEGVNVEKIFAKMCHIQHEFGILPLPPRVSKNSKTIITFHTVLTDTTEDGLEVRNLIGMGLGQDVNMAIGDGDGYGSGGGRGLGMQFTLMRFENSLEGLVGYIVHNEGSKKVLQRWTKKDIFVVDHGSFIIPDINKKDARTMLEMGKTLGIGAEDKIGFVFGFQSPNKNYNELVTVAKRIGMKLVISGAKHGSGNYRWDSINNIGSSGMVGADTSIIFLDKFLTELEVNLFALASDVLLFNYPKQDHYSVSGALHRIIGAGRPCIISDTKHFADVKEWSDGVLKFDPGNLEDLERKIREGLDSIKGDELGVNARKYAERTSWENVAKRHLEIYTKYVSFDNEENREDNEEKEIETKKEEATTKDVIDEIGNMEEVNIT